ncbi:hypothetical protein [uncultured Tateyamaria sp.]|uniref:hypothetical protein n=1 Tax=uncultured Tateyamaria sp. TaxID=455651 RepID=UPI002615D078|nr:hypothetical protein [uncultured Tateyamaria sp.]
MIRRLFTETATILTACLLLGTQQAAAEEPTPEEKSYVDGIFDLENLGPIEIDEHRNKLVLSVGAEILEVSTFPIETVSRKKIDFVPEIIRASKDFVFALGYVEQQVTLLDGKTKNARGQIFRGLGVSPKGPSEDIEYQFLTFDKTIGNGSKNRLEQATILEIDDGNRSFISSVTSNEINVIEFGKLSESERVRHPFLITRCGTPNQLSIGDPSGEEKFYVVSISGSKTIEIGSLDVLETGRGEAECVSISQSGSDDKTPGSVGMPSLNHVLTRNKETGDFSLVTFDFETRALVATPIISFFGEIFLEVYQSVNAKENISFPTIENGSRFGILTGSDDGGVILVSGVGQKRLHRFRLVDRQFEYLGAWNFDQPIRTVKLSRNGRLAVVVTGDGFPSYIEEVTVIRDLEEIPANWKMTDKRYSIRAIQEELNEQGERVAVDGRLGPITRTAISKVIEGDVAKGPKPAGATKAAAPLKTRKISVRPKATISRPVAKSVSRAIEGAFPMGVFR